MPSLIIHSQPLIRGWWYLIGDLYTVLINNLFAKTILLTILHISIHSFLIFFRYSGLYVHQFSHKSLSLYLAIMPIYFTATSDFSGSAHPPYFSSAHTPLHTWKIKHGSNVCITLGTVINYNLLQHYSISITTLIVYFTQYFVLPLCITFPLTFLLRYTLLYIFLYFFFYQLLHQFAYTLLIALLPFLFLFIPDLSFQLQVNFQLHKEKLNFDSTRLWW